MWQLTGYIFVQLILGISSQTCKTNSRSDRFAKPDRQCQFPFIFEGVEYNGCIDVKKFNLENICFTRLKSNGETTNEFGFCSENCPRHEGCVTSSNQPNKAFEANKPCIFPFKNQGTGIEYNSCSDVAGFKNVCATKVDGNQNAKKIGVCGESCSSPSENQKLTVETYTYDFRKTLSKDSGQYLWNDGRKDKCGQGFGKFCLESFEAT